MSSMKNQISEVINEDLEESIKSNTGRNTPSQTPKNSIRINEASESKKKSADPERIERKNEPIEVMEMEHDNSIVPEEDDLLIKNIFKENEADQLEDDIDVRGQIKDLLMVRQQQNEKHLQ
jgi:hypothetical protein